MSVELFMIIFFIAGFALVLGFGGLLAWGLGLTKDEFKEPPKW
jgi:hypothetical protein